MRLGFYCLVILIPEESLEPYFTQRKNELGVKLAAKDTTDALLLPH